ncbi:hypothetical protein DKAM_0236 [Desulfurococcus amylolyticus 1221n]|uniref:Uncharacterized protein n=1 Tax=Desulfurococcus amylolyticus (strain DSM 18924 / JCM 16383 / VKM B-2413 / 1221n) TaxID=490899 RepID=B8D315_DESA1|nr:hypothetical protein DKAM_0236 [Desulfurococcus amylolyticus 1221n]
MGSWAAVEPNGTGLPSRLNQPRLGALLPPPRQALSYNSPVHQNAYMLPWGSNLSDIDNITNIKRYWLCS